MAPVHLSGPYFRITGGTIWDGEHGVIANYGGGTWKYRKRFYTDLYFEGECRLMLGITRDLSPLSGQICELCITRNLLSADGVPFARFDEVQDMWAGLVKQTGVVNQNRWQSLWIVSSALLPTTVEGAMDFLTSPLSIPERIGDSNTQELP